MKLSRREFLKAAAVTSTMAAVGVGVTPGAQAAAPVATGDGAEWYKSVCRYCGTGCGVLIGVKNGKVVAVKGDPENTVNKGLLCVKGYYLPKVIYSKTRVLKPLIRKNGELVEASWDEALDLVASKLKESVEQYGPDSVGFYGSGQNIIEETYIFNKLFKGCIGTNNVDGNPRLCMASAVAGYIGVFGSDEPSGTYDDLDQADVMFITGANMAEAHPVLFSRIAARKAQNPNLKIIVADPRKGRTNAIADLSLVFKPGTDLHLLNAMAHIIVNEGLANQEFCSKHVNFNDGTNNITFEEYKAFLEPYTPGKAAEATGLSVEDIRQAALIFAEPGKKTTSMWTMGLNERVTGVFVNQLVHNLHLITGKICEPGSTPLSLTGQPSACGSTREGGGLSHLLPGHRMIANEQHREEVAKVWGVDPKNINPNPGLHATALFAAATKGDIKVLWVQTTNPAQSLPNLNAYIPGMRDTFLVVSEAFHPTETTKLADVILPAAFWCEKEGFYGNTERRTQHMAKAIEPAGEAKPDVWAMIEVAKRMGYGELFQYKSNKEIFEEYRQLTTTTDMPLASYDQLVEARGMRWPVVNGKDTSIRYAAPWDPLVEEGIKFYAKPDGKAVVFARPALPPAEVTDDEYPFYLTNGRVVEQWHTATMTGNVPEIQGAMPENFVEIHPDDAARLGIKSGDKIKLISRRGEVVLRATTKGRGEPQPGLLFAVWFDPRTLLNLVTIDAVDPASKEPEYKICAVKIDKV